ncbi:DNA topoisomerase 1 [Oratosquilla oratoria]|uniref:DNA topoisomerase 1 n=1 Tax=Oratosquilla oratoria TaxID=337810 RepID=UPI003F76328D
MAEDETMAAMEVGESPISNGLSNGLSNGISNHKEHREHKEHKHKHKDKDRERDRDREKEKERSRDKDRHKSSHKDKDRDKDRHSSSHKSSHKDRDKDKDREKEKSKEKERHRDDKDRHREKDKDKERHRDKDREKDKDRHRDKDKHKEKDKNRHRDDKDRKHSGSDKKDRDRDKDRDRHSSHKSSHKDKDRSREKDKERHKEKLKEKVQVKEEPEPELKEEPPEEEEAPMAIKEEPVESEEEDKLVISEPLKEETSQDEDDIPLSARKRIKEEEDDDEDDLPLSSRKKPKAETKGKKRKKVNYEEDEDEDFKPEKKKVKKEKKEKKGKAKANANNSQSDTGSPTKKTKKEEEQANVWKWWEETKRDDGLKWTFLEHKGPVFAESYVRLPPNIKFYYEGKAMLLSQEAEEVGGFYAKMLAHDYTSKEVFNTNFFKDWRKVMTSEERERIRDLSKCDFKHIYHYYTQLNEERKNRSKEEKKALKERNEKLIEEYGWCNIDGHRQRIGNFKIEPPGLFRGRGEHPKQGMLKKRIMPEDVIINVSKDSVIPKPPEGYKWKEVRHDPNVTWLACWVENVQGQTKYVMLNAASKLKGEKDWQKYETARKLHKIIDRIRDTYKADWKSKEMRIRQRAVAMYFIDKLALRAGNEKDEDQADTVGCCSLRVEHISLHEEKDGKEYVVVFDFLGKDSIRYYNEVPVEKRVFKNLQLFVENKQPGDDLFDRLNTQILNKHLNEIMDGLTAKVFRTYNASRTLQEQLAILTSDDDNIAAKILSYNRANRAVAILCNHQRAVPKTFEKSMANLQKKIDEKKEVVDEAERELKSLKKQAKQGGSQKEKMAYEKKKKAVERLREQLHKLELSATDKEENKQIALGTSKLNYLDPRISVAWCKKNGVPVEKVYNKTQRQKFQWAIDMATAEYDFTSSENMINKSKDEDDEEDLDDEEE